MTFQQLVQHLVAQGATDIHLHTGFPVMAKVGGELKSYGSTTLTREFTQSLLDLFCDEGQKARFNVQRQVDVAYSVPGVSRFRVNLFRQRGSVSAVLRVVQSDEQELQKVNLSDGWLEFFRAQTKGLILVCGPMGSGKTTTLARLVDEINRHQSRVIVTVEDPIEYLHRPKRSVVLQRELGSDVLSPSAALQAAMRQNPDVIVLGEIRDSATAAASLEAAQTERLVLSSINAANVAWGFQRLLEFFPAEERPLQRIVLAESLAGLVGQRLLPGTGGERSANYEVFTPDAEARKVLRGGQTAPQLYEALQNRMQTFDQHLVELYVQGQVDLSTALASASDPERLRAWLEEAIPSTKREEPAEPRSNPAELELSTELERL